MTTQSDPEIVLYDLACTKNVCFSPVVWRIRLMLNHKRIPYKTIFLEFPDIEPTLKGFGLVPGEYTAGHETKYTVPAIHHIPTNTYMMDSFPIAHFLNLTYPSPPLPMTSELGLQIETQARSILGKAFRMSIMPREINILSPRSQEYFRRTREASLGHKLEDLLDEVNEEEVWIGLDERVKEVGRLIRTNCEEGPFVLGERVSYTDFFIAGSLQSARVVDEGVWRRIVAYEGFRDVYDACLPFMVKND